MQIDEISEGGAIEIEVRYNGKTMNFRSEVVLVKNNSVLIESIKVDEQTIGFTDNCLINFLYKDDGKLYIWENVKVKLVRYDGTVYHKINLSGDGIPYNRREAYRMYIGEDMAVYINTASGPSAISVLVKDISETGVAFITTEDLDVDRTFRLKLKDNNALITLSGVIVRKEFLENLNSTLYGCRFIENNNKLLKFIAKRQGEELRKNSMIYSSPSVKKKNKY